MEKSNPQKTSMLTASQLIHHYQLQAHPEGGWYKETYKSTEYLAADSLPKRFSGQRSFCTAIYFLLEKRDFSAFHRIKSDECWHFYSGDPLEVYVLQPSGKMDIITLGNDPAKGYLFQYVVPANCWFASRPAAGSQYSFVGCTVAPGFEFVDFEMANGKILSAQHPQHKALIDSLCR